MPYNGLTQEQVETRITALQNAMSSGVLSATIDGRAVSYASFEAMEKALRYLQGLHDQLTGTVPARKIFKPITLQSLNDECN